MTFQQKFKKLISKRRVSALAAALRPDFEKHDRECPICGYVGHFDAIMGHLAVRFDAACPSCGSRERHRMQVLFVAEEQILNQGVRLLHFAPDKALRDFYTSQVDTYETADISPGRADYVLNIESISKDEGAFDVVVANHVLEHVDHRKALPEIFRILRPGGAAVLSFPIIVSWETTYEDPEMVTQSQRHLHFGQGDHTRYYGRDIEDEMKRAGFLVTRHVASGPQCAKHALTHGEVQYLCRKPL